MYDMITIGDIKLDAFLSLDDAKKHIRLKGSKLEIDNGEKISVRLDDQQTAGSAPNVATALARMEFNTAVLAEMGQDQTYLMAQRDLTNEGVDTRYITPHKNTQSAYSAVLNIEGEKTILASYTSLSYKLPKKLSTKWLFMSEMGTGYEKLYKQIIKHLKKSKTKLGFNPGNQQIAEKKQVLYDLIANTTVLFVNVEEGQRIVGSKRIGIKGLAKKLFALGPSEVIITDGRRGSYGFDGKTLYQCPMFPGPRVEATGAGDSFAAAYLGARMHGEEMREGLKWGAVNSAEVVLHVGPTPGLLKHTQIQSRLRKNKDFAVSVIS